VASSSLAELLALWDFADAAASETRFRDAASKAAAVGDTEFELEALTQAARAAGLQRRFSEAHQVLDGVEARLPSGESRTRIRLSLERGRIWNSSGAPERASPLFLRAWESANSLREEFLAIDAAHMLGIVEPPESAREWNRLALERAEASSDPPARRWRGSLRSNIGWAHHDAGEFDKALECFEEALRARVEQGEPELIRVAKWCVARALRSLGRLREALALQTELREESQRGGSPDGYVEEEIGECLLELGRADEARPHFAAAHAALSKDAALSGREPERLERLRLLGRDTAKRE